MLAYLQGKKTYILVVVGIIYAISGLITGNIDIQTASTLVWGALTAGALRHGISTAVMS